MHNSSQIIAVRNSKYRKNIGDIRQFYQEQHQNWYVIDGFHSKWWVWNEVIKKVKMVNKHMQIYLERTKAGKKTGNPENKIKCELEVYIYACLTQVTIIHSI